MLTPVEATEAKGIQYRTPHSLIVRWNFFPLKGGKYRKYLRCKEHAEIQIKWLCVCSTDELYRALSADIPEFFKPIIRDIYKSKQSGLMPFELVIGDGTNFPLFSYDDEEKWSNPTLPKENRKTFNPFQKQKQQKPLIDYKIPDAVIKALTSKGADK